MSGLVPGACRAGADLWDQARSDGTEAFSPSQAKHSTRAKGSNRRGCSLGINSSLWNSPSEPCSSLPSHCCPGKNDSLRFTGLSKGFGTTHPLFMGDEGGPCYGKSTPEGEKIGCVPSDITGGQVSHVCGDRKANLEKSALDRKGNHSVIPWFVPEINVVARIMLQQHHFH